MFKRTHLMKKKEQRTFNDFIIKITKVIPNTST